MPEKNQKKKKENCLLELAVIVKVAFSPIPSGYGLILTLVALMPRSMFDSPQFVKLTKAPKAAGKKKSEEGEAAKAARREIWPLILA